MSNILNANTIVVGQNVTNKIICGDRLDTLNKIPPKSVHLIITSPPYNLGIDYDNHNDSMPYKDYLTFLEDTWRKCYDVLVDGGRICINVPSVRHEGLYKPLYSDVIVQMQNIGYLMRGDILWYKQNISGRTAWGSWKSPSNPNVIQPYEHILIFSKKNMKLVGDKSKIDISKEEFIDCTNAFWHIKPQTQPKGHPAPFPEKLIERLVKFYSFQEMTVLDPFGGSGTVAVVAQKTNRNFIHIDNSILYCELANSKLYNLFNT